MPNLNDYHNYKNSGGGSNNGGGSGCGGWIIGIIIFFLICFIFDGASWAAIETLLALGFIAYLMFK